MTAKIYHNPRCSKSRATLELLRENGVEPQVIEYLNAPPSASELRGVLAALGKSPREVLRAGEDAYKSAGLDNASLSDDELIEAMVATPILIERPIVVVGEKAVIGRPPANVLDIL